MDRLRALLDAFRANYFVLPAVAVVVAFVAGRLAVGIDVGQWVGDATVDSARAVLSTVASATITFASISFSVSLLIMQQGSSQFSPRVIHGLTRDPFNRRVIAFVLATFTYCLVVLQRVRGPLTDDGEEVVPRFAVAVGLALGVIAVLAIVAAIHHTSRQMDVSEILGGIVDETVQTPAAPAAGGLQGSDTTIEPPAATHPPSSDSLTMDGFARSTGRPCSRRRRQAAWSGWRSISAATPSVPPHCARSGPRWMPTASRPSRIRSARCPPRADTHDERGRLLRRSPVGRRRPQGAFTRSSPSCRSPSCEEPQPTNPRCACTCWR